LKYIMLAVAAAVLAATPAWATGGKPGHDKVTVCHKGKTLKVDKHALKGHLRHGDKAGACSTGGNGGGYPTTPPTVPAAAPGEPRILLCMPYPVYRAADRTLGLAADIGITATDDKPWTDGTLARNYIGVGATCDNLGGTQVTAGRFIRGVDAEYPVWRR
jgi:hypothetical protein